MSFFSKQAFEEDEDSDIEYINNNSVHNNWNLQSIISQHTTASSPQIDNNENNVKHLKQSNTISNTYESNPNPKDNNSNTNTNTISINNTCETNNNLLNILPILNAPSKKRKLEPQIIDNDTYTQPSKKAKICGNNDKILSVLKSRFGFSSFREKQRIAIESCLNGKDILLLMPTGSGKSICFQLPPLITNKIAIVISPLISLMKNHVNALQNNNINAILFNSTVKDKDKQNILQLLQNKIKKLQKQNQITAMNNDIEIFYTTPETLNSNMQLKSKFKSLHFLKGISLFAIDECHCISSWGHDFRPKYRLLNQIRNNYSNVPIMAVTATATPIVQNDIIQSLQLNNPKVIISNFDRPNLYFKFRYYEHINTQQKKPFNWKKFTKYKRDKKSNDIDDVISTQNRSFADDVKTFISEKYPNACGIIYTFTRKDAEHIASYLQKHSKLSIEAYHAGFTAKQRNNIQQKWETNEINIICSTNAFGMGIDKCDVRFIIHNVITQTIESYYQQIGRAGRDGKYSDIICYYSYKMTNKLRKLIFDDVIIWLKNRNKNRKWERGELKKCVQNCELYKRRIELLEKIKVFAEGKQCRRKYMLGYFGSNVCGNNSNNSEYKCCDYCDDSESINAIIDGYNQKKSNAKNRKRYGRRKKGEMQKTYGNVYQKRGKRGKKNMLDVNNKKLIGQKAKEKEVKKGNDNKMTNNDNNQKFTFENVFGN